MKVSDLCYLGTGLSALSGDVLGESLISESLKVT